jgi:hypothetical protein
MVRWQSPSRAGPGPSQSVEARRCSNRATSRSGVVIIPRGNHVTFDRTVREFGYALFTEHFPSDVPTYVIEGEDPPTAKALGAVSPPFPDRRAGRQRSHATVNEK